MKYPLCDKYGFNADKRQRYVALMGFGMECHAQLEYLHENIIKPNAEAIVDEFYAELLLFPEIGTFIAQHSEIDVLKKTQIAHLGSYGLKFDKAEYFEQRLRIGLVHAQIKLPLSYYKAAFRILDEILINYITELVPAKSEEFVPMIKLVSRLSSLDMSLAIETYHNIKVQDMSSSIKALRDERKSLSSIIDHDELTQVASRSRIFECLSDSIENAPESNESFCVAMIDLDYFKSVNDNFGHLVGDQILKDVAFRMKSTLRENDMLGRYGGEEFVLVFASASLQKTEKILQRICKHIADEPFQIEQHSITMTVSIGVTDFHAGDNADDLLGRADHALYKAKSSGRNHVVAEYYKNLTKLRSS